MIHTDGIPTLASGNAGKPSHTTPLHKLALLGYCSICLTKSGDALATGPDGLCDYCAMDRDFDTVQDDEAYVPYPRVGDSVDYFTWNYWRRQLLDDSNIVIVNGVHYRVEPDIAPGEPLFAGHAGREFAIQFHDGRYVVTHNLWHQGKVPPEWLPLFPDNAVFVGK